MDLTKLSLKLSEFLNSKNFELYDVVLEDIDQMKFLVIKISDINLDDIVKLNTEINEIVDANFDKYYKEPYFLEVTSAGINRELRTMKQQQNEIGQNVIVETKNGKFVMGVLVECSEDFVVIGNISEDIQITRKKIVKITLDK